MHLQRHHDAAACAVHAALQCEMHNSQTCIANPHSLHWSPVVEPIATVQVW